MEMSVITKEMTISHRENADCWLSKVFVTVCIAVLDLPPYKRFHITPVLAQVFQY